MLQNFTVARPYARAVFDLALDNGCLQEWSDALNVLAIVSEDPQTQSLINDPNVQQNKRCEIIAAIVKELAPTSVEKISQPFFDFLRLLAVENRLVAMADINTLYQEILADHQGQLDVNVISASELNEAQRARLKAALEKKFKLEVNIDYSCEKALMGGAIIRSGSWVIDGSVRGKLNRLSASLA